MNIEAGKYYRMRCGGAVRIEEEKKGYYSFRGKGESWTKEGNFDLSDTCLFDLVAEITEAEYNRIVNAEDYASSVLDTAETALGKMYTEIEDLKKRLETAERNAATWEYRACDRGYGDDIEALKAENELLKKQNAEITRMYQGAQNQVEEMFETRRFEAARAAMQAVMANPNTHTLDLDATMVWCVQQADALLKALEEKE